MKRRALLFVWVVSCLGACRSSRSGADAGRAGPTAPSPSPSAAPSALGCPFTPHAPGPRPSFDRVVACESAPLDGKQLAELFKPTDGGQPVQVRSPDGCWVAQGVYAGGALVRLEQWQPGQSEPGVVFEFDEPGGDCGFGCEYFSSTAGVNTLEWGSYVLHRKTVKLPEGHSWQATHDRLGPDLMERQLEIVERSGDTVTRRRESWTMEAPRRRFQTHDTY